METASVVLICTACTGVGGVLVKILDKWWRSRSVNVETDAQAAAMLRKDLFRELEAVKEEVKRCQADLTDWKNRYYSLQQSYNELLIRCLSCPARGILTPAQLQQLQARFADDPSVKQMLTSHVPNK